MHLGGGGSSQRSSSASSGFFKRQGTISLVERAGTKHIEESKLVEAQGRTSRGLTVTPLKRKGNSSTKASGLGSHSKGVFRSNKSKEGLTHEDVCEREPRKKTVAGGGGGAEDAEYDRYVKDIVKKSLFVAKFDFIPEVEELEEEILKII